MHYRFPLAFIVLTTIVIALRVWIEHETPYPPVAGEASLEGEDTAVTGAIGSRRVFTPEPVSFAKPTPSSAFTVSNTAANASRLNSSETVVEKAPISRTPIGFRSSGPDGRLWTDDDVTRSASPDGLANATQE